MSRVNLIQLRREIAAQEARVIQPRMKEILEDKFTEEKQKFLSEFDNHPVTRELEAGPSAGSSILDVGNLYSLLGFVKNVKPVDELRNALEIGITKGRVRKVQSSGNRLKYSLEVRIPTLTELKRRTELLTWTTRSFIDLIENGVSNFKRYIFDGDRLRTSRSGTGIQLKGDIGKRGDFKGVNYITKMIKEFQRRLKSGNKR